MGFTAGAVLSFALNRRYTFRVDRAPLGPQALRFTLVTLASVALSAVVAEAVLAVLEAVRLPGAPAPLAGVAHGVTIGVMTIFNFFAMKLFALRAADPRPHGAAEPVGVAIPARGDLDTSGPLC